MPGKLLALGGCFSECERQAGAAAFWRNFFGERHAEADAGGFHVEGIAVREDNRTAGFARVLRMGKIREWFRNASLRGKILLLIVLGGILPLGIVMGISFYVVRGQTEERLIYALNQGYTQVYQAVGDKLSRLHNISTLFAVNDMTSPVLRFDDKEMDVAEQLMLFENINSYAYGLEMTLDSSNIIFFIEDDYLVVNTQSNRYHPLTDAYGGNMAAN